MPLSDVWKIHFLNPKAKERVNYPTQKPIEILEQIIKLTTDEGDLVFDGFMGSGTTLVAAKLLNRHYIGCDISYDAYTLSIQRLNCPIKTESILLKSGYKAYDTKPNYVKTYLELLGGKLVQRNKYIDGFINSNDSLFVPVKILQDDEDLDTVLMDSLRQQQKEILKELFWLEIVKARS